ncbi:hypothetical protein F4813DRAFT_386041 [Daldinia decipiens]|uniref:uncharacterized protein n=1 Tax=Daldinia decipiens TaxID=326647 RepID=UPI0020C35D56|nr:uncharacterized protein F4813DRAFT_386041 [Daldinia decipiens]KAI1661512.1 hypothetical protein F4813DRAFT_386041 [Daldinia decipiens]
MYRQTLIKIPSQGLSRRTFSTTIRTMSAGDTGAPNKLGSLGGQGKLEWCPEMPASPSSLEHRESPPGSRGSDAFQKREKANEDYSIRQREKEKLLELRKKLREQQDHLQKLSDHIDELTKDQGGEHN